MIKSEIAKIIREVDENDCIGNHELVAQVAEKYAEQRFEAGQHETIVIGEGELEHPIAFLEAELDSLKDAYRKSTNGDYSRMVVSVKKAIKILKERQ